MAASAKEPKNSEAPAAAEQKKFEFDLDLKPKITVVGVGGAGGNAVNNMIKYKLLGVEFIVCNTDAQALNHSQAENKLQLGLEITQGLGAGSRPEVGRAAAEESMQELQNRLRGSNMAFVTAGMGGGTGSGAAPVIARIARELGILTIGVVTKPFHFEGTHRMRTAEQGIEEMQQYVDTLIVIPNQNLFRIANEKTTFAEAFKMADDVLYSGVRGVTDLMIMPGLINLDFADIRTVMSEMGKAMMGTGEAEGENRAIKAAEAAIANPLLDDVSMKGAKGVLINITGGYDMTLVEVDQAIDSIRREVDPSANIIFGSTFEENAQGKIRLSVVATGIGTAQSQPNVVMPVTNTTLTKPQDARRFADDNITEPAVVQPAVVPLKTEPSVVSLDLSQRNKADTKIVPNAYPEKRLSFFERLTNRNKNRTAENTGVATAHSSLQNPSISQENHSSVGKENSSTDSLDIPAFLRRQS